MLARRIARARAARARTRGAGAPRARTSPRSASGCSRCRASSSSAGSRARRTSSSVLDAFCGDEQLRRRAEARLAWRELGAARRRHDELTRDAAAAEARLAELRALVEDTEGMEPGQEDALREERERLRHLTELVEGAAAAAEALDPEEGDGAAGLTAAAERALAPVERLAPELAEGRRRAPRRRAPAARDGERAALVPDAAGGRSRPARGGRGASSTGSPTPGGASAAQRTRSCSPARRRRGRSWSALDEGHDPRRRRRRRSRRPRHAWPSSPRRCRTAREAAAGPFADAVAAELRGIGHGRRRVRGRAPRARPRRDGRRRGGVPDPAERRAAVRAGRRDGLGRRALARSRSRSPRSAAARRWSSTRSTPASAARPPTASPTRSRASPSAPR